jgi:hypothetical protein
MGYEQTLTMVRRLSEHTIKRDPHATIFPGTTVSAENRRKQREWMIKTRQLSEENNLSEQPVSHPAQVYEEAPSVPDAAVSRVED